jgi:hypothetical protein
MASSSNPIVTASTAVCRVRRVLASVMTPPFALVIRSLRRRCDAGRTRHVSLVHQVKYSYAQPSDHAG